MVKEAFYLLSFLLGIYKISLLAVCSSTLGGYKIPLGNSKEGIGWLFELLIIDWDDSSPLVSRFDPFILEVDWLYWDLDFEFDRFKCF